MAKKNTNTTVNNTTNNTNKEKENKNMTTAIMTKDTINALSNKELKNNLRTMLTALESGKKATWVYAHSVSNIVKAESFKEDFETIKNFADFVNMTKGALILSLSFLLAACSSIPQNIKGNNQPDIQKSFVAVHNQPGLYVGQQARFGGKVINVINGKTDTLLEIAVLPLDSYAKPDIEANYQGRLLARQSGFLDPVNYRNHFVTILGTIQGEQPGFINKVPYNFLEVNMQGIQVWHLREVVNTTYNLWDYGYGAFWPEPGWGAPYYTNAVSQVTPELVK